MKRLLIALAISSSAAIAAPSDFDLAKQAFDHADKLSAVELNSWLSGSYNLPGTCVGAGSPANPERSHLGVNVVLDPILPLNASIQVCPNDSCWQTFSLNEVNGEISGEEAARTVVLRKLNSGANHYLMVRWEYSSENTSVYCWAQFN